MTTSKNRRHFPLPDPSVEQLMERAKNERAEFIADGRRRFADRLKSLFRPVPPTSAGNTTVPVR